MASAHIVSIYGSNESKWQWFQEAKQNGKTIHNHTLLMFHGGDEKQNWHEQPFEEEDDENRIAKVVSETKKTKLKSTPNLSGPVSHLNR